MSHPEGVVVDGLLLRTRKNPLKLPVSDCEGVSTVDSDLAFLLESEGQKGEPR